MDTAGQPQARAARWTTALVTLAMVAGVAGCGGSKEKKPGQSLASVNGEEITALQLNEELQRSGISAAQQEQASKQLLESLIDRQLLDSEAVKEKLDRDPKVVQAVERAKALILAQAYLQKHVGAVARPTRAEVEEYFRQNPGFFSNRKVLDMRELVISSSDMDAGLKGAMDAAKSLDEVAAYLDAHKLKFARTQVSRSTSDLPPELSAKLLAMNKGQLFIIKEGERSLLISIADVKDAPVALEAAAGQIEQFLMNKKSKAASDAEVARLRATAKIEYLNKAPADGAPAPAAAAAAGASTPSAANERGAAALR
ncbi:peptidyl-prolyl cis-trans isomerase, EpsD family [Rugamonas sp. FT107W]|uniref:peptidylprolyl isomerase n=2 Tax=Duganella vulcania TaxID=2692166 RepID=A0A845HJT8_9BURK|nr:peptidyl-prolyl cis-trans isomerase, EpsD family [Duganella vulcania]